MAITRQYDNFLAFVPTTDVAIFASQSLELRHDGAKRYDPSGAILSSISSRRGRYLKIPPGGREGRQVRFIVQGFRNDPETMTNDAVDDIQTQLFAVPRGLVVPES